LLGGSVRFQDGAIVANNPSIIALQEAQCLWPGRSIDVLVSVGTGKNTPPRNERRRLKLLMHAASLLALRGQKFRETPARNERVERSLCSPP